MSDLFTDEERETFEALVSGTHVNALFMEKVGFKVDGEVQEANVIVAVVERGPKGDMLTAPVAVLIDERLYPLLVAPEDVTEVDSSADDIEDFLREFRTPTTEDEAGAA